MSDMDAARRRIEALLAKTTARGCTEAEAEAAAALAADLMARHGLSEADLIMAEASVEGATARQTVTAPLWGIIAGHTGCCLIRDQVLGRWRYIGREPGPTVARYLHVYLERHIEAAVAAWKRTAEYKRKRTTATRRRAAAAFRAGMVNRLGWAVRRHFGEPDAVALRDARAHARRTHDTVADTGKAVAVSRRHSASLRAGWTAGDGIAIHRGVGGGPAGLIERD